MNIIISKNQKSSILLVLLIFFSGLSVNIYAQTAEEIIEEINNTPEYLLTLNINRCEKIFNQKFFIEISEGSVEHFIIIYSEDNIWYQIRLSGIGLKDKVRYQKTKLIPAYTKEAAHNYCSFYSLFIDSNIPSNNLIFKGEYWRYIVKVEPDNYKRDFNNHKIIFYMNSSIAIYSQWKVANESDIKKWKTVLERYL